MVSLKTISDIGKRIRESLSLRTYPLGIKFYKDAYKTEEMMMNINVRRPLKDFGVRMALCQVINISRTYKLALGISAEDMWCTYGALAMGLLDEFPEYLIAETSKWHAKDDAVGKVIWEALKEKFLPLKSIHALVISPLETIRFEPDVIIVYGSPAQISKIAKAFTWHGIFPEAKFVGLVACSSISSTYLKDKPQFNMPCSGEWIVGRTEEDEIGIVFPAKNIGDVLEGLEGTKIIFPYPPPKFSLYEPRGPEGYKITYKDYIEWKTRKGT